MGVELGLSGVLNEMELGSSGALNGSEVRFVRSPEWEYGKACQES
jgi:hypothetical protein